MDGFWGFFSQWVIIGGMILLTTAAIGSSVLLQKYMGQTAKKFKEFTKDYDITKLSGNRFLNQLIRQYGNDIKVNRTVRNTKAMIVNCYENERIWKIPIWKLSIIEKHAVNIIIMLGLLGGIINMILQGTKGEVDIWKVGISMVIGFGLSIFLSILRLLMAFEGRKDVLTKTLQDYLDNTYYYILCNHKSLHIPQKKGDYNLGVQLAQMQEQVNETEEEISESIRKVEMTFTELEKLLHNEYKSGAEEAAAMAEDESSYVDMEVVEEMIEQLIEEK